MGSPEQSISGADSPGWPSQALRKYHRASELDSHLVVSSLRGRTGRCPCSHLPGPASPAPPRQSGQRGHAEINSSPPSNSRKLGTSIPIPQMRRTREGRKEHENDRERRNRKQWGGRAEGEKGRKVRRKTGKRRETCSKCKEKQKPPRRDARRCARQVG